MTKKRFALVATLAAFVSVGAPRHDASAYTVDQLLSIYNTPDKFSNFLLSQPSLADLDALLTSAPTTAQIFALVWAHPFLNDVLNDLITNYPSDSAISAALKSYHTTATADVVAAANAYLATLDSTEQSETVLPYTLANVEIWSNLPGVSRNGPTLTSLTTTSTSTSTATGTAPGSGAGPMGAGGGPGGTGGTPPGGSTTTIPTFAMTATQSAAALALIKAAVSTPGFTFLNNVRTADDVLGTYQSGYGSANYHVAMIGTPSTTAPWMLQVGGHHIAYNITFNGTYTSATPMFLGVEPPNFSQLSDGSTVVSGLVNGTPTYFVNGTETGTAPSASVSARITPLEAQRNATYTLLTAIQADENISPAAKISGSFDDVTMSVASSTSHDTDYPFNSAIETEKLYPTGTTNRGVLFSQLSPHEQIDTIAAIAAWVRNAKADSAAELFLTYVSPDALAQTYVGYAPGEGGTADFRPFPNDQADASAMQGSYLRIDGPRLWIEAIVQSAVVFSQEGWVHYHTIWRDKTADYGGCFATGAQASTC